VHSFEYTPFIVEVCTLTIGADGKGVVIVENKRYPMQFPEKVVRNMLNDFQRLF
jgi:hypothetical protein